MPIFQLSKRIEFPHPSLCDDEFGLLAVGGDLAIKRLLLAYSNGIFPWPMPGYPLMWFTPDPRYILYPSKYKVSKSLRQIIRNDNFTIKFDTCFNEVIRQCAKVKRKDEDDTWINYKVIRAYNKLHELGLAHSVETFYDDELVGGLYGVSLGGMFCGESMFYKKSNASKVALFYLVEFMKLYNFDFIDTQIETPHFTSFGAEPLNRSDYLNLVDSTLQKPTLAVKWTDLFHNGQ